MVEQLTCLNFFYMFMATTMPFTSNLVGHNASNPLAVDPFAFHLLLGLVLVVVNRLTAGRVPAEATPSTRGEPGGITPS